MAEVEKLMDAQKESSRACWKGSGEVEIPSSIKVSLSPFNNQNLYLWIGVERSSCT